MNARAAVGAVAPHPLQGLRDGPLARAGGVAVFDGLPDGATCEALRVEAWNNYAQASRQERCGPDHEEGRGGLPPRALTTGGGGPVQDALYASPWLHTLLSQQCGVPVAPTGNRGSYSYYVEPGDFLGLHLDVVHCDVTLITVLHDDTDPLSPGGALAVYPGHVGSPLSVVRAAPERDAALIRATPGQTIVLLGSIVPHQLIPLGDRGQRVIGALCFEARESG